MENKKTSHEEREISHSHLIQGFSPIIFLVIWFLDSYVLLFSIYLNNFLPFLIRLILFISTLIIALILIYFSQKSLFNENHQPSQTLITKGILKYIRNPLYFGVLLIYVAFLFLSISLISIAIFIIIFLIYNRMVNYEEKILEQLFAEEYLKYKKKTSKWIPNPLKKTD